MIFCRAKQHNLMTFVDQLFCQFSIMVVWPAFRRTKFRTRAKTDDGAFGRKGELATGQRLFTFADLQLWPQQRLRQIFSRQHHAFIVGQGHIAFDHQRPCVFIQHARIVEQAVAHFTTPTGTMRNTCKKGHQRGFKRVRQHISAVIALFTQAMTELTPFTNFQSAMPKWHRDRFIDFRHPR
ncbi:hypothetical protein SDC9_96012 [bioreactor metagenome]|uniref:Uncharacterized protein n=1 Tax=bioreactor metagenome TaxID=1076179 RepID=A0A645AEL1_9ZZZZ